MALLLATLCLMAWVIIGLVVAEHVRIRFGLWWLRISVSVVMLWPLVLLAALRRHPRTGE